MSTLKALLWGANVAQRDWGGGNRDGKCKKVRVQKGKGERGGTGEGMIRMGH